MITIIQTTFKKGRRGGKIVFEKTAWFPAPSERWEAGFSSFKPIEYTPQELAEKIWKEKGEWQQKKGGKRREGHYYIFLDAERGRGGISTNIYPPGKPPRKIPKGEKEIVEEKPTPEVVEVEEIKNGEDES